MNTLSPAEKIHRALEWVGTQEPIAVPTVLANWKVIEDASVPTARTNGLWVKYNPVWVDSLSLAAVRVVMLHEVGHVLSEHGRRRGNRDQENYNIAADLALNCLLQSGYLAAYNGDAVAFEEIRNQGCFVGHGAFKTFPPNLSMEEYYKLIAAKDQATAPKPKEADGGEGADEEAEESDGDADGDDAEEGDKSPSNKSANGGKPGEGESGGSPSPTPKGFGEIEDTPESELREEEARMILAALTGEGGYSPFGLGNLLSSYAENLKGDPLSAWGVNWRTELERFLRTTHCASWSYARPSRRHGWRTDVLLPARRGRNKTRGLFVCDTSGSMKDDDCQKALDHTGKILAMFPQSSVTMLHVDTAVRRSQEFHAHDFPIVDWKGWAGRGGTDLKPAFEWARKQSVNYDWMVVVSDMEWPWWELDRDPGLPVLWVCTRTRGGKMFGSQHREKPVFGKVIQMNPPTK